jgi:hypothetical protein
MPASVCSTNIPLGCSRVYSCLHHLSPFRDDDANNRYNLVHEMLVKTDSGCADPKECPVVDSGLMTYPMHGARFSTEFYTRGMRL